MIKPGVFLIALLSMASTVAKAIDVRAGEYQHGSRQNFFIGSDKTLHGGEASFNISRSNSVVTIFDVSQKITYNFDLSQSAEQDFPKGYYDFLRRRGDIPGLSLLLDKISVDHLVESKNKVTGNLNLYVDTKNLSSAFGRISAKIVIPGAVYLTKCEQVIEDNSSGNFTLNDSQVPCYSVRIFATSITNVKLSVIGYDTNALEPIKNLASLILDFALKLAPIGYNDSLMRVPRM